MAICPKCKAVITELSLYEINETKYHIYADSVEEGYDLDARQEIECPECSEVLFESQDEAQEWLKHSDELGDVVQEKLNEKQN